MKKKAGIYVLIAYAVIWLAACGQDVSDNREPDIAYAWLPEYIELENSEWISCQDIHFAGDCVYYKQVFFDVVNQTNLPVLKKYSLTGKNVLREMNLLSDTEDGFHRLVTDYWVQDDGRLYTVASEYSYNSNSRFTVLCAYDPEWNQEWEKDITDITSGANSYSQISQIAADNDGRLCLAASDALYLFDGEGSLLNRLALEDMSVRDIGTGRDEKVYLAYSEPNKPSAQGYCLAELDFEKNALSDVCTNFPEFPEGSGFTAGIDSDFLVHTAERIYEYDLASQSSRELLSWLDCDINGHLVDALGVCRDGGLTAFMQDENAVASCLILLNRVEADTLLPKTQLVIGCIGSNSALQAEAAAFNRQSSTCHVTIKNYEEEGGAADANGQEPSDRLGMALATGIDCPDIVSLEELELYQIDIAAMAENGAFEDLEPFLYHSSILTRNDYPENVLDSYRYHGSLAGIPYSVTLRTVAGRTSDVGEESGWTLDELLTYAAAHPQQELLDGAVRDDILYDCLVFNQDLFIDRQSGQCHFDSEEFRNLLLFASDFPAEYDYGADERSSQRKVQDGDTLLYETHFGNFYTLQELAVMFGEPVTYIGYPSTEGSGCLLQCGGALAISAQSANKEAAWEFIEYHLSREIDRGTVGFAARSSALERQMQDAVTVSYYVDEHGEPILDKDGKPVPKSLGGVQWSFTDPEIVFRTATEAEVQQIKELIENSRTAPASNDTVMAIIREEAEPFFLRQKSVDETMNVIQNRVQLYISEQQ